MKILVVEDDSVFRKLLQRSLEKWGHEVVSATNGAEAIHLLTKNDFSIVITDWMMPEVDGLELVRHIRANDRSDYIYIIMLTYKALKEDVIKGMDAGADDFLAKPFDREELRVRIRAGERVVSLERKLSQRNQELHSANTRMKHDLETAASIQNSLLPKTAPEVEGIRFAWKVKPCEELAGDTLNVFHLDQDHMGLYVLDVSGHGIAAALLSVTLSRMLSPMLDQTSLLKYYVNSPPWYEIARPAEVANQLNKRFQVDTNNEQFFTLLYGILEIKTRKFSYISAGHPGMVYIPRNRPAEIIEVPNLPIGFSRDYIYKENFIQLSPGDRLYLYSDGIIEARNPDKELFGTEQLLQTLNDGVTRPLKTSLNDLLRAVENWSKSSSLEDDVSMLALEIS